jgi:adenylate cyclase
VFFHEAVFIRKAADEGFAPGIGDIVEVDGDEFLVWAGDDRRGWRVHVWLEKGKGVGDWRARRFGLEFLGRIESALSLWADVCLNWVVPANTTEFRKLAAIMFTDMVGYSKLAQRNEALAMELLEEHRRLLRHIFPRHNGLEIETAGDAFLVEFASALEAVRCAIGIQEELFRRNQGAPAEKSIRLRIGIHVGDVVHKDGKVMGDAVNIAARIEPLSAPNGICISNAVFEQVRNKLSMPMATLGPAELKNIDQAMVVHRIVMPWEDAAPAGGQNRAHLWRGWRSAWAAIGLIIAVALCVAGAGWWRRAHGNAVPGPGGNSARLITSLAVKPLDHFSGDTNNAYLSDGMTEALCTALGNISALRVPGRSSVMRFKGGQKSIQQIAKELNVDAIVEGSIQRAGDRIMITVQLIDAAADRHLWATNYERNLGEFFKVQNEVAKAVAEEIQVRLTPEDHSRLAKKYTTSLEATEFYLNGRFQMFQMTETGFRRAEVLFDQAIVKDPAFALAHAAKVELYAVIGHSWFVPPGEATVIMRKAAMHAVELDDSLAEAHLALGITKMVECDWEGAEREYQRAIALNPRQGFTRVWYGTSLCFSGQLDAAKVQFNLARDFEPLSAFVAVEAGWVDFWRRQYDQALPEFQRAVTLEPNLFFGYEWSAMVNVQNGQYQQAIDALEKALTVSERHQEVVGVLGYTYALAGRTGEAKKLLEELGVRGKTARYSCPIYPAMIYTALGDTNQALAFLERAARDRDLNALVFLKGHPFFDRVRGDPRFPAILKLIGLNP